MMGTRWPSALTAILLTSGTAWAGGATGSLTVICDQPAEVLIDGEAAGTTPLKHRELPAAEYLVSLKAPGYAPFSKAVQVRKGEDTKVVAVLQPAPGKTEAAAPLDEWQQLKAALTPLDVDVSKPTTMPDWVWKGSGSKARGGPLFGVGRVDPKLGSRWQDKVFACNLMAWREVQSTMKVYVSALLKDDGHPTDEPLSPAAGKLFSREKWGSPPFTLNSLIKSYTDAAPAKPNETTDFVSSAIKLEMPDRSLGFPVFTLYEEETSSAGKILNEQHVMNPESPIADAEKLTRALQYVAASGVKLKALARVDNAYYCLVEWMPTIGTSKPDAQTKVTP